jgi:regulator of extracellular matrix RemA (YlzA/DUF370 family)
VAVGFGGIVAADRIVAVANPESAPIRRAVRRARAEGQLLDLTFGRRVRAILFMDSGHIVRIAIRPQTLLARWRQSIAVETTDPPQ